MYSEFDYKKVLAVLQQLRDEIRNKTTSNYAKLEVATFEEHDYKCFDSLGDLSGKENFRMPKTFSLIFAQLSLGEDGNEPIFMFYMGQKQCVLEPIYTFNEDEKVIFKDILPFEEISSSYWDEVLAILIKKTKTIVRKNLRIDEETNDS